MRVRLMSVMAVLVSLVWFGATSHPARAGDGNKGGKKRQTAGEKVDLKELPSAVTDAAKKEAPNANWTGAEKLSHKKLGSVYLLQGTDGKYHVSLMISSSGDVLRVIKAAGHRKKSKGSQRGGAATKQ